MTQYLLSVHSNRESGEVEGYEFAPAGRRFREWVVNPRPQRTPMDDLARRGS